MIATPKNWKWTLPLILIAAGCGGGAAATSQPLSHPASTREGCSEVERAKNGAIIAKDTLNIAKANLDRLNGTGSRAGMMVYVDSAKIDVETLGNCVDRKWLDRLATEIDHATR
jgi:hypothetical protein